MTDLVTKPPYVVPTMADIQAMTPNGLRVASTFAGGGGSSTGYRMAGYTVLYANEFVPAAADTYRANARPGTIVDTTDIRNVTGADFLNHIGLSAGELDVLDGSPPCASFSTAGKRSKKWGTVSSYSDTSQRTDDLFYEYARLVNDVQPKVFVAENVSGLVKGVAKGYFIQILRALRACGYQVSAKLLDASWLGVPQARQRLIFVGVRNDLSRPPVHPRPFPYRYSVREALPWISGQARGVNGYGSTRNAEAGGERGLFQHNLDRPAPTVMAHGVAGSAQHQTAVRFIHDTSGQFSSGEFRGPAPTITTKDAHFQVHDDPAPDMFDPETGQTLHLPKNSTLRHGSATARKFTLGELRAICSFPPDYVLTGTYSQRWERMGRSVPPLMMKAIASTVRDEILCAD